MLLSSSSVLDLRRRVALACRIAFAEGLHEQFGNELSGHISVREGPDRILMPGHLHKLSKGLKHVSPEDVITVDLEGKKIEGKLEPVDEVIIHTSIYKARPEISSVAHLHLPFAVALSCTNQRILPISIRSSLFADGVPILSAGPDIIETPQMAALMVKKLGNHKALIHRGHGAVTVGRNLEEACLLSVYLEGSARNQFLASQFGKLRPFEKRSAIKYAKSAHTDRRQHVWKYFEDKWKDI